MEKKVKGRGGDYRLWGSCLVEGVALFDQQTGGGEAEKPLMLIVGSGLNSPLRPPCSD